MESFPLFFRIRAITFMIMMLFSFLWFVLLSVEMFARWTMSDQISQSLMILFIIANTITLILLPILMLVKFRVWLDMARLLLLFVLQAGSSTAGTYWSPRIHCPDQTPDDIGVCQLIGVYTMIACWIIPAILLFYSTYFVVVVYLQSRIPVVVEPQHRSGADPEMGSTDSVSSWREMMKGIVGVQGSSTDTNQPRPLVLPTMVHTSQSSLPRSLAAQPQSTLSNAPQRQSTILSLPNTSQQVLSVPSRHHSLPAFGHVNGRHIPPILTVPIPHPHATNTPSHPSTPSSYSYSTPSSSNPRNQSFTFGPGIPDSQSPRDHRWRSKHLSMVPSSSSPREMQNGERSPTTPRSTRAKLSKPLPAHFL